MQINILPILCYMVCHLVLQKLIEETVRNIEQSLLWILRIVCTFLNCGHICVPFTSTFHTLIYAKHWVVTYYQQVIFLREMELKELFYIKLIAHLQYSETPFVCVCACVCACVRVCVCVRARVLLVWCVGGVKNNPRTGTLNTQVLTMNIFISSFRRDVNLQYSLPMNTSC